MPDKIKEFKAYRSKMNDRILAAENAGIKRFFNLDTAAYQDGALPGKTKEMLGLCPVMAGLQRLHQLPCAAVQKDGGDPGGV